MCICYNQGKDLNYQNVFSIPEIEKKKVISKILNIELLYSLSLILNFEKFYVPVFDLYIYLHDQKMIKGKRGW